MSTSEPTVLAVLAALAGVAFVLTGVVVALRPPTPPNPSGWLLPAGLALAFAAWTTYAVVTEGLLGFWPEHVGTAWEAQIWFDLLLAAGVLWWVLQPRLRRQGIAPLPWFALVALTGSIGLLLVVARLLHAERSGRVTAPAPVVGAAG